MISIHALRGEGDVGARLPPFWCGISIHALRGEGDLRKDADYKAARIFQSTPSVGRAT